jgi:hypothetical protein
LSIPFLRVSGRFAQLFILIIPSWERRTIVNLLSVRLAISHACACCFAARADWPNGPFIFA